MKPFHLRRTTARSVLECGSPLCTLHTLRGGVGNPEEIPAQSPGSRGTSYPGSHSKTWRIVGPFVLLLAVTVCARAQSYSIDWFTIDGGGGTSAGGAYSVSGTIGQPDASPTMTGGPYSLTGGFWGVAAAIQTPGAPRLSITLNSQLSTINISWPLPATDFVLDQTTALVSPPATNSWIQVPSPYQTNATDISITVPAPTGNRFFRLRRP